MTVEELIPKMTEVHRAYGEAIGGLSEADFLYAAEGKWTAGMQTAHLVTSVTALKPAFKMPRFALKQMFGTANRPSRDYDGLVGRYKEKLANGGKASSKYVPDEVPFAKKDSLLKEITDAVEHLNKKLSGWSEEHMDKYILPHPLLGKITIREMIYFSIYHVQHHQEIIFRELKLRDGAQS